MISSGERRDLIWRRGSTAIVNVIVNEILVRITQSWYLREKEVLYLLLLLHKKACL